MLKLSKSSDEVQQRLRSSGQAGELVLLPEFDEVKACKWPDEEKSVLAPVDPGFFCIGCPVRIESHEVAHGVDDETVVVQAHGVPPLTCVVGVACFCGEF